MNVATTPTISSNVYASPFISFVNNTSSRSSIYQLTYAMNPPYRPRARADQIHPLSTCYKSLALGHIRLLDLQDFDDYDCLVSSIQHASLDTVVGTYTAISYTWDEHERIWYGKHAERSPQNIIIDGLVVAVSGKVAAILALMQKAGRNLVWIDSICINQSDTEEKNVQVKFMGDIYASAFEVSAILGSPDKTTDSFFDAANECTPESDITLTTDLDFGHVKIHLNQYWHRAWIFQEISLARKILLYCGSRCTSYDAFMMLYGRLLKKTFGVLTLCRMIWELPIRDLKNEMVVQAKRFDFDGYIPLLARSQLPFLSVLETTNNWYDCASDPRDLLFSRLSLASDANILVPHVDYDIPTEELYMQFAANSILSTRSLFVITFASNTSMKLPSWTPDWSSKECIWSSRTHHEAHRIDLFRIPWKVDPNIPRISPCGQKLTVQGRILYTVHRKSRSLIFLSYAGAHVSIGNFRSPNNRAEGIRPGDLVCILEGCPIAVYLRSVGDEQFAIVGRQKFYQWGIDCPCKWRPRASCSPLYYRFAEPLKADELERIPQREFTIV